MFATRKDGQARFATHRRSGAIAMAVGAALFLTTADALAGKGIKKVINLPSARAAPAEPEGSAAAARGIEKKDIRRGMVIAKPGSITPHARSTQPTSPAVDAKGSDASR
ncbi:MAG: hypothetical protein OHK0044_06210 [Burkholderiaceae bacterium]